MIGEHAWRIIDTAKDGMLAEFTTRPRPVGTGFVPRVLEQLLASFGEAANGRGSRGLARGSDRNARKVLRGEHQLAHHSAARNFGKCVSCVR